MTTANEMLVRHALSYARGMGRPIGPFHRDTRLHLDDVEIARHGYRTSQVVRVMLKVLRTWNLDGYVITAEQASLFVVGARHHDIGKIGVPPEVLHKPGKLSQAEYGAMKRHTTIGSDIAGATLRDCATLAAQLQSVEVVAHYHHERWDGSGYPAGLRGQDIPLSARIVALADSYDAMVSPRVYKPGMPHELAMAAICAGAGSLYDPALVDVFAAALATPPFRPDPLAAGLP